MCKGTHISSVGGQLQPFCNPRGHLFQLVQLYGALGNEESVLLPAAGVEFLRCLEMLQRLPVTAVRDCPEQRCRSLALQPRQAGNLEEKHKNLEFD